MDVVDLRNIDISLEKGSSSTPSSGGRGEDWRGLLSRPVLDTRSLELTVSGILGEVRQNGDEAVRKFTLQFDKAAPESLEVSAGELEEAAGAIDDSLKAAMMLAKNNIEAFHQKQVQSVNYVATMPGVQCWRKSVAIEKVGLYIPGGSAPLFSTLLMLAIPARIAGCREIVLCSPPDRDGRLHPAILYAAQLVGV